MMEYDLYSNDWEKIELLHSEHLHAETLYQEQLHRWSLQYGRAWGIVQLGAEDFQVYGDSSGYEVSLRLCKAITRHGYLVDVDSGRPPLTLQGSNDSHRASLAPIYLGVAMEKEEANAGSSQTGALLDRPALRWRYKLAIEPDAADFDWLQVGRMRKEGQKLIRDEKYIPQCVHLRSHPSLRQIALDITQEAGNAMAALEAAAKVRPGGVRISTDWLALMGALTTALAPATVLLDWDVHPRRYLERLELVLRTYAVLLPMLEKIIVNFTHASDRIGNALSWIGEPGKNGKQKAAFIMESQEREPETTEDSGDFSASGPYAFFVDETHPGMFWGEAFHRIKEAFEALTLTLKGLTPISEPSSTPDDGGRVIVGQPKDVKPKPF